MIVRYSRELDAIQNGCLFMMARLFNSDVFIETTNHIGHHLFSVTRSGGEVGLIDTRLLLSGSLRCLD